MHRLLFLFPLWLSHSVMFRNFFLAITSVVRLFVMSKNVTSFLSIRVVVQALFFKSFGHVLQHCYVYSFHFGGQSVF